MQKRIFLLPAIALIWAAGPALAGDGRIEISQSAIGAGAGFPHTIDSAGSYVLTGHLDVPDGKDGLLLADHDITVDLNGFAIRGTHICEPGSCGSGTTRGIEAVSAGSGVATRSTIVNGHVQGFGDDCVSLGPDARLEGLVVSGCGGDGISAQERALVQSNRVSTNGAFGLSLNDPAVFSNNILSFNGLGSGAGGPFDGGSDAGGNLCDTRLCDAESRRYYQTIGNFTGSQALTSCAEGFHFASLYELRDTSALRYDTSLGRTGDDSGSGPPAGLEGYIRTGGDDSSSTTGGIGNCQTWTSSSVSHRGSVAVPNRMWADPATVSGAWDTGTVTCSAGRPTWCIED